ncbi:lipopolysaccharide heptosyltransferase II [Methylobacter sp. S3L5C]|uniref:lipopolysaccharide heptosyltransferase II n=1 Tax=Methylobacter sp. S3L5C TaxID=2839024 RepID=UPI00211273F5|nr:lipopolysaccharide heptosyltransferase II [Methylobacter sp. S3L5C]
MKNPPRILVVGPSWVGDMVMAQSLFITLKNAQPDCQIDVLAPSWSFALLARMPQVAKAIAMPLVHGQFGLLDRIKLGRKLRAEGYDQAIVLPNSWKSALIPYFADIPVRTGYVGECRWGLLNDARKLDKSLLTMTVQRFVALGLPDTAQLPPEYSVPELVINPDQQNSVIEKFHLNVKVAENGNAIDRVSESVTRQNNASSVGLRFRSVIASVLLPWSDKPTYPSPEKILALCPGAEYGAAKRWPASYYAQVARQKIAEGWQVWLFGSDKDKAVAEQINAEVSGQCIDFSGRTSLAEAVDLLSLVDAVVTNDSGLMHVAAALDKKIIALYGSSDPHFTPPLNAKAHVISLHLDCSPCFKRECPLGHTRCLNDISPEQVIAVI